jgi:flagellar basal body-associated protein FliL
MDTKLKKKLIVAVIATLTALASVIPFMFKKDKETSTETIPTPTTIENNSGKVNVINGSVNATTVNFGDNNSTK